MKINKVTVHLGRKKSANYQMVEVAFTLEADLSSSDSEVEVKNALTSTIKGWIQEELRGKTDNERQSSEKTS